MIQNFDKEIVFFDLSGKKNLKGTMIDMSNDMIVLFNGTDFIYIPIDHIQNFGIDNDNKDEIKEPSESPSIISNKNKTDLTLAKVLSQAQGIYVEIYVTGNQPLHGYITNIMSDYFVFYSPIYKTMYIAFKHLKWLIPYTHNQSPYGLSDKELQIQSIIEPLSSTLEAQVEKMKNELVVFNLGEKDNHIGKINNVNGQIVEIQTARTNFSYHNLLHIKTVHQV
ncbi:DUF2642 domain-containing protein [Viridibacillus sp. YIM B01967]|uniref:DUF2642 domain-containing protein n=1 Tax=Viridibacillus soli TaxID=2798301 RepID=A0ABS1HDD9_9BACL|nr:DUF2642 domain-containing protein [Viridibacillus soli]